MGQAQAPLFVTLGWGTTSHTENAASRSLSLLGVASPPPDCPKPDKFLPSWASVLDPPLAWMGLAPPRSSNSSLWSSKTQLKCHLSERPSLTPSLNQGHPPHPGFTTASLSSVSFIMFVMTEAISVREDHYLLADCPSSSGLNARGGQGRTLPSAGPARGWPSVSFSKG